MLACQVSAWCQVHTARQGGRSQARALLGAGREGGGLHGAALVHLYKPKGAKHKALQRGPGRGGVWGGGLPAKTG